MDTYDKAKSQLETYVLRFLGRKDVSSILASQLLPVLKQIEAKGPLETTRRTKQRCGQVFSHGIGLGFCERDITSDFQGLLEAPTVSHHAAITDPAAVGALLCKIDRYPGRALTRLALKLSPLVFLRPHNLRKARWQDVELENGVWRIIGRHMKKKIEHRIEDHILTIEIDLEYVIDRLAMRGQLVHGAPE